MINKKLLLDTVVFIDNEFLDLYVELINNNLNREHETYKTQKHHIIPKCYYKLLNLEVDNSKDNVVNLLYKDHVLAHYYIVKCSKESKFKYKNLCAIRYILRNRFVNESLESLIDNIDYIQDIYEESKHINCLKEDTPQKISKSLKGRISIEKDGKFKYIDKNQLSKFANDGWKIGHNRHTEDSKHRISKKNLGRIKINKNGVEKFVKEDAINVYLSDGWEYGIGNKNRSSPIKGKVMVNLNNKIVKYVLREDLDYYLNIGYSLGGRKNK